ncbi:hypothetical protein H1235_03250 [Pseudoxanthomonas sp. NC8]|nr:hypothetical protein H1235_03250 [Pseudoxanthomonas sp. NC8]
MGNYTISYINGSLQITPALLTVNGATTSSTYTATSKANTFTTSGLLGGDSVTGVSGWAAAPTRGPMPTTSATPPARGWATTRSATSTAACRSPRHC